MINSMMGKEQEAHRLQWTTEGKSIVASWGAYGLRVKRLGKGKYWWCLSGVLQGKRAVKLRDGMVRGSKEGRNMVQAALCGVSTEYGDALVKDRLSRVPWFRLKKGWRPMVGRVRV